MDLGKRINFDDYSNSTLTELLKWCLHYNELGAEFRPRSHCSVFIWKWRNVNGALDRISIKIMGWNKTILWQVEYFTRNWRLFSKKWGNVPHKFHTPLCAWTTKPNWVADGQKFVTKYMASWSTYFMWRKARSLGNDCDLICILPQIFPKHDDCLVSEISGPWTSFLDIRLAYSKVSHEDKTGNWRDSVCAVFPNRDVNVNIVWLAV